MEPNNIENQFRKKLNEREIQPSSKAWDRLDAMLAVADSSNNEQATRKPKRNRNWMYIAASFLGFILIATVFLSRNQEMVDIGKETIVFEIPEAIKNETTPKPETLFEETPNTVVSVKTEKKQNKIQHQKNQIDSKEKPFNKEPQVFVQNIVEKPNVDSTKEKITKPQEKVANRYINADDLLASVESVPQKEKLFKSPSTIKVDSNNLLSEVDGELELSFREKVIQSVSKNYQEVKVALGNRNLKD